MGVWLKYASIKLCEINRQSLAQNFESIFKNGLPLSQTNSFSTSILEKPLMVKIITIGYTLYRPLQESEYRISLPIKLSDTLLRNSIKIGGVSTVDLSLTEYTTSDLAY